jgi:hypothetical protein
MWQQAQSVMTFSNESFTCWLYFLFGDKTISDRVKDFIPQKLQEILCPRLPATADYEDSSQHAS